MLSRITRQSWWFLGVIAILLTTAASAQATSQFPVPEISPGSVSAGLAMLTGAVLILRSLRR
jgi:hypothetical protein